MERGAFAPPSRRTLGAYLFEDWLPSIARDIRPTTYANYRALARAYVGPWQIARKKLSDLTELELKRFYNTLAEREAEMVGPSPQRQCSTSIRCFVVR